MAFTVFKELGESSRNDFNDLIEKIKPFDIGILIVVIIAFLFLFVNNVLFAKTKGYPPGPIGIPFLGYLPFMSKNVHLDFIKLSKKYGDVFSIPLGTESFIVLNGAEIIKEALSKSEFSGRPPYCSFGLLFQKSAFFAENVKTWKEQRKFVFHSLKELGLGRLKIESEIQNEISQFLDILKAENGKAVDIKDPLSASVSNNTCALVFGTRYKHGDPVRRFLDEMLDVTSDVGGLVTLPTFYPWVRNFRSILKFIGIHKGVKAVNELREFCSKEVENHKKTFDPRTVRDFIDSYLIEMKYRQQKNPDTSFSYDMLVSNLVDLYNAGSGTVRLCVLWCLYTVAAFPDVQKKVQQEIWDVLGPDGNPEFRDQMRMPYTHAVLLEIMRWKTVDPLNVLRYTTEDSTITVKTADATLKTYNIPKDKVIIANFWAVHHDPKLWTDPGSFIPERFLTLDGSAVNKEKCSNFMVYSLGKRICPGETMANMEIFLYFTSILQKFDIIFPEGIAPTFDAELKVAYRLKPFKLRYIQKAAQTEKIKNGITS